MFAFRGSINGTVQSLPNNLPTVINNFTLVNKTGGGVVYNVYLIGSYGTVNISPYGATIAINTAITDIVPRVLYQNDVIKLVTSGSVDYDFELDNTQSQEVQV